MSKRQTPKAKELNLCIQTIVVKAQGACLGMSLILPSAIIRFRSYVLYTSNLQDTVHLKHQNILETELLSSLYKHVSYTCIGILSNN